MATKIGLLEYQPQDEQLINQLLIMMANDQVDYTLFFRKLCDFSVSNQSLEKFVRKKQLISTYTHKPVIVTLCDYQFKKRSFLTSPFGKLTIPITVDRQFIDEEVNVSFVPPKKAIYNIR